jgi:hypothetical protein
LTTKFTQGFSTERFAAATRPRELMLVPVNVPSSVTRLLSMAFGEGGTSMTKYQPLRNYLTGLQQMGRVRLTFAEVAAVLGESLPPSAFKYREWWANRANTTSFKWTAAWQDAGFVVEAVHQDSVANDGWVEFVRRENIG